MKTESVIKAEVKLMSIKNGACCHENNMDSEVEVTSRSKDKGEKSVLDGVLL